MVGGCILMYILSDMLCLSDVMQKRAHGMMIELRARASVCSFSCGKLAHANLMCTLPRSPRVEEKKIAKSR